MPPEAAPSEETLQLREEVQLQKEEAARREARAAMSDLLKNRVSVAAIIITTALSFIGNLKGNRSGAVDGARASAESARRQSAELWAFYQTAQAERTESELAVDRMRMDFERRGIARDDPAVRFEELHLASYEDRIAQYDEDAKLVFFRIQDLERVEDENTRKAVEPGRASFRYDLGTKIMTLALILLSVTIISNKPWLLWGGLMLASVGMLTAFDGYVLFF